MSLRDCLDSRETWFRKQETAVAADVVRTVALEPTLKNVGVLGLLVLIRTFLSWSLTVEIEGRWPWQSRSGTNTRSGGEQAELGGRTESLQANEGLVDGALCPEMDKWKKCLIACGKTSWAGPAGH